MGELEVEDIFYDTDAIMFVQQALKEAVHGNMENYDEIVALMDPSINLRAKELNIDAIEFRDKITLLVVTLRALSEVVTQFDVVHHQSLYTSILGMNVWICQPPVRDALIDLVVGLAASSGSFLDACLDMLVCHFVPPPKSSRIEWFSRKNEIISHILSALQAITTLVPLAPMRLLHIIERRMPSKFADKDVNAMYIECLLKLESSNIGEFVRSSLLKAIVDKLLDFDVELKWDYVQQSELNGGVFDMELEHTDAVGENQKNPGISSLLKGERSLETLDHLMVIMFQYLESCKRNSRLTEVFEILLESFYKTVLTAQKSKFIQFLMFYACSLDPEISAVRFAHRLGEIFLSNSEPVLYRICAVSYLASYVSRAKFLSSSLITRILQRLVAWCSEYCDLVDKKKTNNAAIHRMFYSGCQAIMYTLCFHMRSIAEDPHLKEKLHVQLEYILCHELVPLKVCLSSIVEEFLKQAKSSRQFSSAIEYFDKILSSKLSKGVGFEGLDMFFPFDPYWLKESDRFIRPNFKFWSTVRTPYDDGDDELDGVSDDEGPEADPSSTANGEGDGHENENDLEYSINAMSITPKETFIKSSSNVYLPTQMPARITPSGNPYW